MWGQSQETKTLLLENAKLRAGEAKLRAQLLDVEYERLGGKDTVSRAKTELVVALIESQFAHLDQAVCHVSDVLPPELWTWQSTTPGEEDQTVLALGATVLSRENHEKALRGMLGSVYAEAIAPWAPAAQGGGDVQPRSEDHEMWHGLIWGSRFFAWDPERTLVAAVLSSFVHDRKTHPSTCFMECNTLEKCHF